MKKCKICEKIKCQTEFHKNNNSKDGLDSRCKACKKEIRLNNLEYWKQRDKNNYYKKREKKLKQYKEYRMKNKEKLKVYLSEWKKNNKNKIKEYCQSEHGRTVRNKYSSKYYHEKKKHDIKFKISDRISNSIRSILKKAKNNTHWECIVGYTYYQLKNSLEKTLPNGITWDDFIYGEYHIDHIVPLSYFNYDDSKNLEFVFAWRIENLRIISAEDNLKKSDKIDLEYQKPLLEEIEFYRRYPDMYRIDYSHISG